MLANIERFVEPELAEAMKAGRLNPAMVNLLARSEHLLAQPVEPAFYLQLVADFVESRGSSLMVAFLPSLNQVSDAYLPVQRSSPDRRERLH